jgi:hypothetical protein
MPVPWAYSESKAKRISHTKGFKYVPVAPIIFLDILGEWTAEMNFLNKTELHEIFGRYRQGNDRADHRSDG